MGKNKNLKKLRKYAALLPVINTHTHEYHYVLGSEMISNGQTELEDGSKVIPENMYRTAMPVIMPINHDRRMKDMYNKHGVAGAMAYVGAVRDYSLNENKSNEKTA